MLWSIAIAFPWVVFCSYWLWGALGTKRSVEKEPFWSRYGVLAMESSGYVLVFTNWGHFWRGEIFPQTLAVALAGVACTWAGVGLAVWARWHLGKYWSARITLKEGHELIRTGPYARLRHPIYTGLDLAARGGVRAIDEWRCGAGLCLIVTGYILKARREESLLAAQFGQKFEEHRRRTGFLFPKLR